MINRFSVFKMLFVVVGVFMLLGVVSFFVYVVNWQVGDVIILLDLMFIFVMSICIESCDYSLIGNSNYVQFDWFGYYVVFNLFYVSSDVWVFVDGGYFMNGDLGNLFYDSGDVFVM